MAIIQCPECGGTVSTTAKQCIHCGAQISICPQCENVWAGGGNFCTRCGYNIAASEQIANNSFGSQPNQYNVQQDQNSYQPQNNYDQNQYAPGQGVYTPYQNAPGQNQYYQNGFDPQQSAPRLPSDFEVVLDMSKSKPLTTVLQKYYPGGFKFLFKFFGILTGVLLGFSVAVPILSMLLRSLESPLLAPVTILTPLAPVALYLSLFTVIIHSGIANFHEPVYNSVLKKQIQASNFDVNSYIRYELCNGWETCTANDIALKKHRIWVLINYQARPESTYLRIVQHIISAAAYVLFGIPALSRCYAG